MLSQRAALPRYQSVLLVPWSQVVCKSLAQVIEIFSSKICCAFSALALRGIVRRNSALITL